MASDDGVARGGDEDGGDDETDPKRRVLYPIFDSHDSWSFEIARDVAEGADAELVVVDFLDDETSRTDELHTVGRKLLDTHLDEHHDVDVTTLFERVADPVQRLIDLARLHDAELVVLDRNAPDTSLTGRGDAAHRVSERVPCNVVHVGESRDRHLSSILVPVAGGPHSMLAASVAGALARAADAVVELFHVPRSDEEATDLFEAARRRLPDGVEVETWQFESEDVVDAIVEQSAYYDVTVVGEPRKSRLRRFVFGSVTDSVSAEATNTVLTVHRNGPLEFGP